MVIIQGTYEVINSVLFFAVKEIRKVAAKVLEGFSLQCLSDEIEVNLKKLSLWTVVDISQTRVPFLYHPKSAMFHY